MLGIAAAAIVILASQERHFWLTWLPRS